MLVVLPPSEAKHAPPSDGVPLDLAALSFPSLDATRRRVVAALVATAAEPDALRRLQVGERLRPEIERNRELATLPVRPAAEQYAGPLYAALDPSGWPPATRERAAGRLVIVTALWGVVRPDDPVPVYRLHVCSELVGLGPLEPLWRTVVPDALAEAAGERGIVVDLRSSSFTALGAPAVAPERVVAVRVRSAHTGRAADAHTGKRVRGELARHLVDVPTEPDDPAALLALVAARWRTEIATGADGRTTLDLVV